jgi:hypothetical protein
LCGHHNTKQKIQQHMQLKKELQSQAQLIKQQRDQLIQMTVERDEALAELKEQKNSDLGKDMKSAASSHVLVDEGTGRGVQTRGSRRKDVNPAPGATEVSAPIRQPLQDRNQSYKASQGGLEEKKGV